KPICRQYWWENSLDREGQYRRALRFVLDFNEGLAPAVGPKNRTSQPRRLSPRPFDENREPQAPTPGKTIFTPEQLSEMLEKSNANHHRLLCALKRVLDGSGWKNIEEMPSAFDLRAERNSAGTIFEAKTVTLGKELTQVRSALSQLLEYRFFYGKRDDSLCLVVDAPISDRRVRFLDATGI